MLRTCGCVDRRKLMPSWWLKKLITSLRATLAGVSSTARRCVSPNYSSQAITPRIIVYLPITLVGVSSKARRSLVWAAAMLYDMFLLTTRAITPRIFVYLPIYLVYASPMTITASLSYSSLTPYQVLVRKTILIIF